MVLVKCKRIEMLKATGRWGLENNISLGRLYLQKVFGGLLVVRASSTMLSYKNT
jgi:hypothetical protein